MDELKKLIREVPDYPKPGILFYDLTTLLKDKKGFHTLIDRLCEHYNGRPIDVVAGIEARVFSFPPAHAYSLGAGFVPVRKPKKLPAKTANVSYALEYGTDTLEIHEDAVQKCARFIICDDLRATGGTAAATVKLVQQLGGVVEGAAFAVELTFLNGRKKLQGIAVFSLIQYDKRHGPPRPCPALGAKWCPRPAARVHLWVCLRLPGSRDSLYIGWSGRRI